MAVTLGFMFRVDNYLPAVAIPPQPQPVPAQPIIIEAEKVAEPTSSSRAGPMRRDMRHQSAAMFASQQQTHTYNHKGQARPAEVNSYLLDIYA